MVCIPCLILPLFAVLAIVFDYLRPYLVKLGLLKAKPVVTEETTKSQPNSEVIQDSKKSKKANIPYRQQSALLGNLIKLPNIFQNRKLNTESQETPFKYRQLKIRLLRKSVETCILRQKESQPIKILKEIKQKQMFPAIKIRKQEQSNGFSPWASD